MEYRLLFRHQEPLRPDEREKLFPMPEVREETPETVLHGIFELEKKLEKLNDERSTLQLRSTEGMSGKEQRNRGHRIHAVQKAYWTCRRAIEDARERLAILLEKRGYRNESSNN